MAQKGKLRVKTSSSTLDLPVYDTSDFSSTPVLKVETATGTGGLTTVDPSYPNASPVKIQTSSNGTQAIAKTGPQSTTIDATLNSQTAEITVYEDTDQDGTADNSQTVSVSDGKNNYTLNNLSGGTGNDYWIEVTLTNSNIEKTAEITSIDLIV